MKTLKQLQSDLKSLVSKRTKAMLKVTNAWNPKEQRDANEEWGNLNHKITEVEQNIKLWNYKTTGWFESRNKNLNY